MIGFHERQESTSQTGIPHQQPQYELPPLLYSVNPENTCGGDEVPGTFEASNAGAASGSRVTRYTQWLKSPYGRQKNLVGVLVETGITPVHKLPDVFF